MDQRDDEARYDELEAEIVGAQAMVAHLEAELGSDVYDRGKRVDYRHVPRTRVHQVSATGRRLSVRPAFGFDTAEREARERLRAYRAELRRARAELAEVNARLSAGAYRQRRPAWCGRAR